MEHHFRSATGEEYLHCSEIARTIRQRVDQSWYVEVYMCPIASAGAAQTSGVCNRGNVQKQIGRATDGCMNHHRVLNARLRQDARSTDPKLTEPEHCLCRPLGRIEPYR